MELYKGHMCGDIYHVEDRTIEQVEESIKDDPRFIINRNEEGRIHSRYLGDRYEPAIIEHDGNYIRHYYLFDGDIKDCEHPFCISYYKGKINYIKYYSSERIKNGEPIIIERGVMLYNRCIYNRYMYDSILNEYKSTVKTGPHNLLENFTVLCDEMV